MLAELMFVQSIKNCETFREGWDYAEALKATLKHYRAWKGKT